MKGWQGLLTLAVCILWTTGCRNQHGTEAMERELRFQEDMIYELQDYIRTYKSHLEDCRRDNVQCRGGATSPATIGPSTGPNVDLSPPNVELPGGSSDEFKPPRIELPRGGDQSSVGREENSVVRVAAVSDAELAKTAVQARYQESVLRNTDEPDPTIETVDYQVEDFVVANINLNPEHTGGYAADKKPGCDGLQILLEPRNADDQIVPPAGEISVALLDLDANDRVAHWKFSAEQVALIAKGVPDGKGVQLELPWPDQTPKHKNLQVYVRLITPDGRRLVLDQAIDISPQQLIVQASSFEQIGASERKMTLGSGWKARTRPLPLPPLPVDPRASDRGKQRSTSNGPSPRRPQWSPYR